MIEDFCSVRVKILGPVEVEVAYSKPDKPEKPEKKKRKKWSRKLKFTSEEAPDTKEGVELDGGVVGGDGGVAKEGEEEEGSKPRIIMVRTENLEHNPFEQTQELKVCVLLMIDRGDHVILSCDRPFLLRSSRLFVTSLP